LNIRQVLVQPRQSQGAVRLGVLPDALDRKMFTILLLLFVVDVGQLSFWGYSSVAAKPFAGPQRALSLLLQLSYLALNPTLTLSTVILRPVAVVMASFCLLSAYWSADPVQTVSSSIRLFGVIGMVTAAQARHGPDFVLRRVFALISGIMALTAASLLVFPLSFTPTGPLAGSFRGFFNHKNTLAAFVPIYLAVAFAYLRSGELTKTWRNVTIALLAVSVPIIALNQSATDVAISVMLVGIAVLFFAAPKVAAPHTVVVIAVLVTGSLIVFALETPQIVDVLGRNATFSDRTLIWEFALYHIWPRQVLGWGYAAFPLTKLLQSDPRWGADSFIVGSLHNSYLTVFADLGWSGLVLFSIFVSSSVINAVRQLYVRGLAPSSVAMVLVLVVYLLDGVTESQGGLAPDFLLTMLLVVSRPARLVDQINRKVNDPNPKLLCGVVATPPIQLASSTIERLV
jgi:exopolysaccharide production protein ExoQ